MGLVLAAWKSDLIHLYNQDFKYDLGQFKFQLGEDVVNESTD